MSRDFLTSIQLYIWGTSAALLEVQPVHGNKKSPRVLYSISLLSLAKRELAGLFDWSLVEHIQPFHRFTGESIYCLHFPIYFDALLWGITAMVQKPEGPSHRSSHLEASPPPAWSFMGPSLASGLRDLTGQCRESFGGKNLAKWMRRKQQPC